MATAETSSLETILDALDETFDSIKGLLGELSPEDWHKPTGCPDWDVQDVVSHIIGVESSFTATSPASHDNDERASPGGAERGEEVHETHEVIAGDVDSRRSCSPAELVEELDKVTKTSMARRRASERSADEIVDGPFGWRLPYSQLLSIRTFDVVAHEQDVRRAVGRPGNLDGKAATLVEDLIFPILEGSLGARVPGLAGQSVRIEVTDRTGRLDLGKVDENPEANDATDSGDPAGKDRTAGASLVSAIRMPFSELLALCCGRADVDYGVITIEGDEALAKEVIGQMGFTP